MKPLYCLNAVLLQSGWDFSIHTNSPGLAKIQIRIHPQEVGLTLAPYSQFLFDKKLMAESEKGRPRKPFSHIKDSIISTKTKYKPLESSEGWRDAKGGPDHLKNDSELLIDDCGVCASLENLSETKQGSERSTKPQRLAKVSADAAIREKIKSWDGWLPVKEDNDQSKGEIQADEANNGALNPLNESATANENSGATKKNSSKKSSNKGSSVASVVGSFGAVVGSVVTRDASMSTIKYQAAILEDMDGANESSDVVDDVPETTRRSPKSKKQKSGSSKTSLATKIGSMVTKHKDKRLVSKDSTVMKFKVCPVTEHDQFLSLYCKESKCQLAICPLCLIERHKEHDVCDLTKAEKQNKENLTSALEVTSKSHKSLKVKLTNARQSITESTRNAIESLEARRGAVMKMFDKLSQEMADQRVETIQVRVLSLPWRAVFLVLLLLSCADPFYCVHAALVFPKEYG